MEHEQPHREGFNHQEWVHAIYSEKTCEEIDALDEWYAALPRECCGARNDSPIEYRLCRYGRCTEDWCPCGTFLGGGNGPAGCPCTNRHPWGAKHASRSRRVRRGHQRKMARLDRRAARLTRWTETVEPHGFWLLRRMRDRDYRFLNMAEGTRRFTQPSPDPLTLDEVAEEIATEYGGAMKFLADQ